MSSTTPHASSGVITGTAAPRWRSLTTQLLSGAAGLVVGLVFFSLPLLILTWLATDQEVIHQVHGLGWGITGGLVVSIGLLSQTWQPQRRIAGLQMALIGILALGVSVALGLSTPDQVAPFVVIGAILAWVHPARQELFRAATAGPVNRLQTGIALAGVIPFGWYALQQSALSRGATADNPHVMMENHYESMAAMAVALVLVGLLGAARTRGWRLPTIIAGLGTLYFGVASIASQAAGSVGPVWGTVAVIAGAAYLVVGLRSTTAHLPVAGAA